ncbi:hypothetical protein [Ferruginibacter sp.]
MYKYFVLLILLHTIYGNATAQLTKAKTPAVRKPVTDSVTVKTCDCLMADQQSITSMELLFNKMDSCLKRVSGPRIDALLKEDGFVQQDDRKSRATAIRAVGQKIGQRVFAECTGFKTILNDLKSKSEKPQLH